MERLGRETSRLQNDVTRRIDDFQQRGVLVPKMADHYRKAIQKARGNPIKFKVFLKQVQEDLDRLDNEDTPPPPAPQRSSPTSSTFSSGTSASVSAFTEIASAAHSNTSSAILNKSTASGSRPDTNRRSSAGNDSGIESVPKDKYQNWGSQSKSTGASITKGSNHRDAPTVDDAKSTRKSFGVPDNRNHSANKLLVDAVPSAAPNRGPRQKEPLIVNVAEMGSSVEEDRLQELFVEMCFFARLGYVQPPCCLRCTYREALMDKNENNQCSRWTIWRKDTKKLLHPREMEGNLLMVQCGAARRLLAGEFVNGYRWSGERQELQSLGG